MKATALVFVLAAAGCYDPDVGPALASVVDGGTGNVTTNGCSNADSNPAVTVSFSRDVRPLMTRSPGGCGPCHLGRATSGLDLSSYQSLRRGGLISGTRMVVPGEPCNSILVQKTSRTPPFGSRMPLNGPPNYSPEEEQIVRDWVAEGAANN